MLTLRCYRVRPEGLARLEAWLEELSSRRGEVLATLRAEGVIWERVYLLRESSGPMLVALSESDDPARARRVFETSSHEVDREHRAVLAEVLAEPLPAHLAFEVSADEEV